MASPSITYASVTELLEHPIDTVWQQFASFGGLHNWASGVDKCTIEGVGVGAIRTVEHNGNRVHERLEAIDDAAHTLRYKILPPHSMPADDVHGNVALRAIDDGITEISWRSDATEFRVAPEVIGARIEQFYRESIGGLRTLLDAS